MGCCSNTPDFGQKIEIHLYFNPTDLIGKKLQGEGFPVVFPPENNNHQPNGPNVYALQDPARPECGLPDPNNSEGLVFNADQFNFAPGDDEVMHFKSAEGTRLCVQRVGLSVGYNDTDPGFATLEAYDIDGNLLGCVETVFECTPPEVNNCFEFMELEFVDQFDNPAIHAIRVADMDASGVAVNCITFSEPCFCDMENACDPPLPVATKSWGLVKRLYH